MKTTKKFIAFTLSLAIVLSSLIGIVSVSADTQAAGLVEYIDFGNSYAAGDTITKYFVNRKTNDKSRVLLENGWISFWSIPGGRDFAYRSVALTNDLRVSSVTPGKTYRVVFEFTCPQGKFDENTFVFDFGNDKWGTVYTRGKVAGNANFAANELESLGTAVLASGQERHTLAATLTVPTSDVWATTPCNIWFALGANSSTTYLDNVYIYEQVQYEVEDSEGNTLEPMNGFAGTNIPDTALAAYEKDGFYFDASHTTFPLDANETITITYHEGTRYTVIDEQGNTIGTLVGEAGQPITAETLAVFDKVGYIMTTDHDVFPQNKTEKITVTRTKEAGFTEYIDFGDSYAASDRNATTGYPDWRYVGNSSTSGSNAVTYFGDGLITFKPVSQSKDFYNRSVALANKVGTNTVTPGKNYRVIFSLGCNNYTDFDTITVAFNFLPYRDNGNSAGIQTFAAKDLECLETSYSSGTYRRYTLAAELTVPVSDYTQANNCNIFFSQYGNTANVYLDNVYIYEQVQYEVEDSEGNTLEPMNGFAGTNIPDTALAAYEKDGFYFDASHTTFPLDANETITITYHVETQYTFVDEQGEVLGKLDGEAGQPITEETLAAFDKVGYITTADHDVFPQSKTEKITVIIKKEAGFIEYIDFGDDYAAGDAIANYFVNRDSNNQARVGRVDEYISFWNIPNGKDFAYRSVALTNDLRVSSVTPGKTYRVVFEFTCPQGKFDENTFVFDFGNSKWGTVYAQGTVAGNANFAANELESLGTVVLASGQERHTLAAELTVPTSAVWETTPCNIWLALAPNSSTTILDNVYIYEQVQYDVVDSEGASLGTMNGYAGVKIPADYLAPYHQDGYVVVATPSTFPLDADEKITITQLDTEEDFENYPAAWQSGATNTFNNALFELSTKEHKSGSHSLHYQYDANANGVMTAAESLVKLSGNSGFSTQGIIVKNGAIYGLTFYVKADAADLQSPVNFSVYAAKGTSGASAKAMTSLNGPARVSSTFTGNGWTEVKYAFIADLTDNSANELFLSVSTEKLANAELYIDDITLTEITSDMGVVMFSTNLGNTSAELSSYYDFGTVGTKIDLPEYRCEDYTFVGWYSQNGYDDVISEGSEITENIVIYADWMPNGLAADPNGDGMFDIRDLVHTKKVLTNGSSYDIWDIDRINIAITEGDAASLAVTRKLLLGIDSSDQVAVDTRIAGIPIDDFAIGDLPETTSTILNDGFDAFTDTLLTLGVSETASGNQPSIRVELNSVDTPTNTYYYEVEGHDLIISADSPEALADGLDRFAHMLEKASADQLMLHIDNGFTFSEVTKMYIPIEKNGRKLVWHDEFENPDIDMNKWCFTRSMNRSDAVYDNGEDNVRIEDNKLLMQVHEYEDTYTLPEGFSTKNTMNFKYGYLEMRAKIPFKHAAWPSFWLKTDTPFRQKEVSQFAEIDIFENFSSTDTISFNLHKWKSPGLHASLPSNSRSYTFENPENLNNEYHIYGFEWNESFMKFYIDDYCYATVRIDESGNFGTSVIDGMEEFHDYAYLIMNNEFFSDVLDWYPEGSLISHDDDLPFDYCIDWVRLYQNPEKESICFANEIKAAKNSLSEN